MKRREILKMLSAVNPELLGDANLLCKRSVYQRPKQEFEKPKVSFGLIKMMDNWLDKDMDDLPKDCSYNED